jgi:hypothetical protein
MNAPTSYTLEVALGSGAGWGTYGCISTNGVSSGHVANFKR